MRQTIYKCDECKKEIGEKHYATQIVAHTMEMLTPNGAKKSEGLPDPRDYASEDDIKVEDIPFG